MTQIAQMKERPILFSGPMVRAILAGHKTQTRRVCTVPWHKGKRAQPYEPHYWVDEGKLWFDDNPAREVLCPYGMPGDRLWVRETWTDYSPNNRVYYREKDPDALLTWRPSIHMPRWASRIMLEVKAVRVERLQEISEADAESEGVLPCALDHSEFGCYNDSSFICAFQRLWEAINGARASWASNPWVWVVEFQKL